MSAIQHVYAWVWDEPDGEALVHGPVEVEIEGRSIPTPIWVVLATSRQENFERFRAAAQRQANRENKPIRFVRFARTDEGTLDEVVPEPPPPFEPPPPDEDEPE